MRYTMRGLCALLIITVVPSASSAQIRASEVASISQTVDGTKITIDYSRPRARGRKQIFGTDNVKWNEVWTPGANYATTLETSSDITLDGHPVPKGKYSLWMVVRKDGPWTLVLDPRAKLFHMAHPDSAANQIRFPVRAEKHDFTDVLTWSVPAVRSNGVTLDLAWINTRVQIDVTVPPSLTVAMPAADADPYLGRYIFAQLTKADSAKPPDHLVVFYDKGILKAKYDPLDDYMKIFALIRISPDAFAPGIYDDKGEIYEVLRPDLTIEFMRAGGKATGVELRGGDDVLYGRATREQ